MGRRELKKQYPELEFNFVDFYGTAGSDFDCDRSG